MHCPAPDLRRLTRMEVKGLGLQIREAPRATDMRFPLLGLLIKLEEQNEFLLWRRWRRKSATRPQRRRDSRRNPCLGYRLFTLDCQSGIPIAFHSRRSRESSMDTYRLGFL